MIIENLLPEFLQQTLYKELTSDSFPWYWNDTCNYSEDDEDLFQLTHCFYKDSTINSDYYNLILPIVGFFQKETNIKIKSIHRIKANLNTKYNLNEKDKLNRIHKDMLTDNYLSLIYYVNDSDGNTFIYDKDVVEEIVPKANQLCYFKSNLDHAGIFPKVNKRRIVINFIVEVEY